MRLDGRMANELRHIHIERDYNKYAEGSVFLAAGETKIICTASVEARVPPFLRGQGKGWITAEYAMLPRATEQRNTRESVRGKQTGRTVEIQRLIGRALRSVIDLDKLGEKTIWIDCDVIQADGGTRVLAITGAYLAMVFALEKMMEQEELEKWPVHDYLAATSVGLIPEIGEVLDLNYQEDFCAEVDMNVVMTGSGEFVEVQGTGEEAVFSRHQLNQLLDLAETGIKEILASQKAVLGTITEKIEHRPFMETVIIATKNQGKVADFKELFAQYDIEVKSLFDYPELEDVEETGTTFEENARLKAEEISRKLGKPVLADDSGLIVDALDGRPGVYSARYAGLEKSDEKNMEKVLEEMAEVADENRTARFYCSLAIAIPEQETLFVHGTCEGVIAKEPKGAYGFGYDPIFYVPHLGKTMAELTKKEKNQISHRANALTALESVLERLANEGAKK